MTKINQNNRIGRYFRAVPRLFVGLVLISTGVGKGLDMHGFVTVLEGYQLLPVWLNVIFAYTLPFIELSIGIALFIGYQPVLTAYLALGLHSVMLSVVLFTLYRGTEVENCGCFGVFFARPLTPLTAVEDVVMLVMSGLTLMVAYTNGRCFIPEQ